MLPLVKGVKTFHFYQEKHDFLVKKKRNLATPRLANFASSNLLFTKFQTSE